jgi:hypothetical protein
MEQLQLVLHFTQLLPQHALAFAQSSQLLVFLISRGRVAHAIRRLRFLIASRLLFLEHPPLAPFELSSDNRGLVVWIRDKRRNRFIQSHMRAAGESRMSCPFNLR